MPADIKNFRRTVTLPGGAQVLLRVLKPEDRDRLIAMFKCAADADLQFFRDDVRETSLVARWAEQVNLKHVVPIVAIAQDQVVGEGMLQLGRGCDRHVAELRVYLCSDFRGRGLGNALIKALVDVGRELGLHVLFVRVAVSQTQALRAFQALGFEKEHTFKDRLMDPDGDTQDVVEAVLHLKRSQALL
jgi:L-amino acid N-acyltransferase YncA